MQSYHTLFGAIGVPADFSSPERWLAVAVLVLAWTAARLRWKILGWWERPLARLARRKKLAVLLAGILPLAIRAALLPLYPPPEPRVHDEFSFLLGADTLAHGRLANPQHPYWMHFESIHILARPAYASAFPIAQAAVLAFGKVVLGHAWAGVCISAGLMCAAICWMLQGWLPARWALLGAVLVMLRFGISSYWVNSYWGGCAAAIGGALVLGAWARLRRGPRWPQALIMAAGLTILANSRPVEGAVFSLAVAAALFAWMFGAGGPTFRVALRQIVLPISLALAISAIGVGYYFARVTGKPWVAPYVLYRESVAMAPHFLWQSPTPQPLYNNREMRNFYVGSEIFDYQRARAAPLADFAGKLSAYWRFYAGPLLTLPLFALPLLWRERGARRLLLIGAVFSLALFGQVWHNAHYGAPALGLAILIVLLAMRRLRIWRPGSRPVGLYLVRWIPHACFAMLIIQIAAGRGATETVPQSSWRWPPAGGLKRAAILRELRTSGQKHLVFVRYQIGHDPGDEWVYNDAVIDAAPVVWARELDPASNQKLMRYFQDRRVWLVQPDLPQPRLVAYQDAPPQLMQFVAIGAPGIEVLRWPEAVKSAVLRASAAAPLWGCDSWNYFFTQTTGVLGPDVDQACYGQDRATPVTFDHWFTWLLRQR